MAIKWTIDQVKENIVAENIFQKVRNISSSHYVIASDSGKI